MLDLIIEKLTSLLPLTYIKIIRGKIEKSADSVIDVGCGRGLPMKEIAKQKKYYRVGVDLFMPYIKEAKKARIHDEYVLCDVCYLPFRESSFDVSICFEVLDHLSKNDGIALLKELEYITSTQIMMSAHAGYHPLVEGIDGNPLQVHKSGWTPEELKSMGFEVRGQGFYYVYQTAAGASISTPKKLLSHAISYLLASPVYFTPTIAAHMICTKTKIDKTY